jgi:hypothetical protein
MSETLNMKPDVAQDAILKLEQCGFLDRKDDGKLFVHGWLKYAGLYLSQSMFKRNPRRMREIRRLHGQSKDRPRTVLETVPTVPTIPDQPKPKANISALPMRKVFVKPNPQEVTEYAASIGFNLEGQRFLDFYESKGWLIGKSPMRSWQAAVRTWKRNRDDQGVPNVRRESERVKGTAGYVPGKYSHLG